MTDRGDRQTPIVGPFIRYNQGSFTSLLRTFALRFKFSTAFLLLHPSTPSDALHTEKDLLLLRVLVLWQVLVVRCCRHLGNSLGWLRICGVRSYVRTYSYSFPVLRSVDIFFIAQSSFICPWEK